MQRLLRINPDINRRNAPDEQVKHHIRASRLQPGNRLPPARKMSDVFLHHPERSAAIDNTQNSGNS